MSQHAENWSQIECDLIVKDYLAMLFVEMQGEKYNKTEHRRKLSAQLNNRTESSVEFKHQNISAVLIKHGYPYITGYKPAFNYQQLLKETVLAYLKADAEKIEIETDKLIESETAIPEQVDWKRILTEPPELITQSTYKDALNTAREFIPRLYNYGEREARNRKLGICGEELVLKYEQQRLMQAGRRDLANEIEWTSKEKGDGAGYDIRSFDETCEAERFIEVKTTNLGKYQPFLISDNEVAFSDEHANQYALYRVFQMKADPRIFTLYGRIGQHVDLLPKVYQASFR